MKDYYAILESTPEASRRQIRDAYRRLAFLWHPDRNPEGREEAHRRFLDLGEALSVLGEGRSRVAYDLEWQRHCGNSDATDLDPVVVLDFADEPEAPLAEPAPATEDPPPAPPTVDPTAAWALEPREFRARVQALARDMAATDAPGRRVDLVMSIVTATAFLVATGLTLLAAFDLVSAPKPPFWAPFVAWLATAACAAWAIAFRESRVERHRPLAEQILRRRAAASLPR